MNSDDLLEINANQLSPFTPTNVQIHIFPPSEGSEILFEQSRMHWLPIPHRVQPYLRILKLMFFLSTWSICCYELMLNNEKVEAVHQISVPQGLAKAYFVDGMSKYGKIKLEIKGALLPAYYGNLSTKQMNVWVEYVVTTIKPHDAHPKPNQIVHIQNISSMWRVPLVLENLIGIVPEVTESNEFLINGTDAIDADFHSFLRIRFRTNLKANLPLSLSYNVEPISMDDGIIYAAILLIALYVIIVFEIIHRTLAAMLASTMAVAILAALNARPSMDEIVTWIDVETLMLLFAMMTLVTVFSETGIFDYTVVLAYRLTGGLEWPLINTLCAFTALLSCFLDNVTTTLLMTPITIRLCEVTKLNPIRVLIYMTIYSNIGGAVTPIGDPPNVIIASNAAILKSGVNYGVFTLHMGVGVFFAAFTVYFYLKYFCSVKVNENNESNRGLRREIAAWRRAAASVSYINKEEGIVRSSIKMKTKELLDMLKTPERITANGNFNENLRELEHRFPLRDRLLLIKSLCALVFVVGVFFLHSFPDFGKLGLAWTALLGAILLLLISGRDDLEAVFGRIEWSTLLFFASLFVLMEALSAMGLIDWIGQQTQYVIMSVNEEHRLAVAIILLLWVSAIVSAFVDNIPLTTMMVKVATVLADNRELNLPLQPLVWALAFGASFGGNGTLLGSSSNILCAGVAEQHGYKFSFLEFLKIGMPVMVISVSVTTFYLLIAHVVFEWH